MTNVVKNVSTLTGLTNRPNARRSLVIAYGKILRVLQKMPTTYAYRQCTEQIVKERAKVAHDTEDVIEIQNKIDCGHIEELVDQAEDELKLARNLLEWKSWEPLVSEHPKNQWLWPPHP